MVIFAAGFNLKKKNFFKYSGYILTYGIVGTLLIFIFILRGPQNAIFRNYLDGSLALSPQHLLVMASVLAATDTVAPMAFLPASRYPVISSVVLGESVLNDVVAILLSHSVSRSSGLPTPSEFGCTILKFFLSSSLLGLVCGVGVALLFKWTRVLHEGTVKPCTLLLLLNYSCYIVAELYDLSAVCALFVCALLSGHYTQASLSEEAQHLAKELAEFMSYGSEAFVFGYFGLTAVAYMSQDSFSPALIAYYTAAVVMARCLAFVLLTAWLKSMHWGSSLALQPRDVCVVALAGCMRGTIAFALILRCMPPEMAQTRVEKLMVSTVLGVVLVNCLVFGALFPVALRVLRVRPLVQGKVSDSRLSPKISANDRHGLHRWWHHVDAALVKPLLCPAERSRPGRSFE